jgi:hypothetical protein
MFFCVLRACAAHNGEVRPEWDGGLLTIEQGGIHFMNAINRRQALLAAHARPPSEVKFDACR